jgi:hypothetical protein
VGGSALEHGENQHVPAAFADGAERQSVSAGHDCGALPHDPAVPAQAAGAGLDSQLVNEVADCHYFYGLSFNSKLPQIFSGGTSMPSKISLIHIQNRI